MIISHNYHFTFLNKILHNFKNKEWKLEKGYENTVKTFLNQFLYKGIQLKPFEIKKENDIFVLEDCESSDILYSLYHYIWGDLSDIHICLKDLVVIDKKNKTSITLRQLCNTIPFIKWKENKSDELIEKAEKLEKLIYYFEIVFFY